MNIDADEVARRYAGDRPGLELVAYEEVGLPFFRLTLQTLIQIRKPVGPIDEFVLRSVDAGLDHLAEIQGVLGLDSVLVEQSVVEQSRQDHVDYRLEVGDATRVLRLTELGRTALQGWAEMAPQQSELVVSFDRLLWQPSGRYMRDLVRPKIASERGIVELASKLKKRIEVSDLDVDFVERALRELPRRPYDDADLISILGVSNNRMVLPAVALVFAADDGTEQQVALAIDGRLSRPHEMAFAQIDGPRRAHLVLDERASSDERPQLPEQLRRNLADRGAVIEIERRIAKASDDRDRNLTATGTATADDAPVEKLAQAQARVREADSVLLEARDELASLPVRPIQTYEHRALLGEALQSTKRRLLIISPWIRGDVVNGSFISNLERLLRRSVKVHIAYGISGDDEIDERSERPVRALQQLASRHPSLSFRHLGNTHAKVLLWDDKVVVTSFNWLSFRGDDKRGFRQEEGILIADPAYVDSQYEVFRSQIEA